MAFVSTQWQSLQILQLEILKTRLQLSSLPPIGRTMANLPSEFALQLLNRQMMRRQTVAKDQLQPDAYNHQVK